MSDTEPTLLAELLSLRIANYKSVGDEPIGFESFRNMNVLIGRNNGGKSTFLDILDLACSGEISAAPRRSPDAPLEITVSVRVTRAMLDAVFPGNEYGGWIPTTNLREFGDRFLNGTLTIRLKNGGGTEFVSLNPPLAGPPSNEVERFRNAFARILGNPFRGRHFLRLRAERDIRPEAESGLIEFDSHGVGFTNLLRNYVHSSNLDANQVERDFLAAVNEILAPDLKFDRINVLKHPSGQHEVYLYEGAKGRVPLSHSGSGIKTIFLTVGILLLVPLIRSTKQERYLFGLEEPENNLHPALLRRLLRYVRKSCAARDIPTFITTHSSIAIDAFANDSKAQIVHVTHDGAQTRARTVVTTLDGHGILRDLDARASDLLQSNSVIWVEGPTDRRYVNRWIELYSNGTLREGLHYQCIFYGGRLLAHLTAQAPIPDRSVDELIELLRANRNCAVIMDSDKGSNYSRVGDTKRRLLKEISGVGGFGWITQGREIENYLPGSVISELAGRPIRAVQQFEPFPDYLRKHVPALHKTYQRSKVLFADLAVPLLDGGALDTLDLRPKLKALTSAISGWNGMG